MMEDVIQAVGMKNAAVLTCVAGVSAIDNELSPTKIFRRPNLLPKSPIGRRIRIGLSIAPILLQVRPDIVHAATAYDGVLAHAVSRLLRIPYVIYAHGNEIFQTFEYDWNRPQAALLNATFVIANSHHTSDVLANFGVDPKKIRIVHPVCDISLFRPVAKDDQLFNSIVGKYKSGLILVTVGNIVKRKGHVNVIRAIARLAPEMPDIVYLIVGDGRDRKHVEEVAENSGIKDRVKFIGKIPDAQLPAFYSLADIFIMASRSLNGGRDVEGFGKVYLEAGACGLCSIGGRDGGVPDAIVENETGLLVDPTDIDALARTIKTLGHDPILRRRMGAKAKARVLSSFTIETFRDKLNSIMCEAISRKW